MNNLAAGRPSNLVNLGSSDLFECAGLERFITGLGDERSHFKTITWPELLGSDTMNGMPEWFVQFCYDRPLRRSSSGIVA